MLTGPDADASLWSKSESEKRGSCSGKSVNNGLAQHLPSHLPTGMTLPDIRFFISRTPWKEEPEIGSSIYNLHRSIRRDRKIKGRSTKELTSNSPRGTGSREAGQSQSCHSSGALSKEIKPILGFCVGSKQRKAMNRKAGDIWVKSDVQLTVWYQGSLLTLVIILWLCKRGGRARSLCRNSILYNF